VQLEQSTMPLSLNPAKMAIARISCTVIEELQYSIKKPWAEVREEMKRGVEFPENTQVQDAME
jgi:hypothetical protein